MAGPDGHVPDAAETEASLLARAQAGDVAAFERLSGAYADRLFMLLLRLLGDRAEAEDVAQEVMLRAWRGITRFRGQSSYFTWLYRIAVNEANRALERRARRPAAVSIGARELELPAAPEEEPSRQAANSELRRALGQALGCGFRGGHVAAEDLGEDLDVHLQAVLVRAGEAHLGAAAPGAATGPRRGRRRGPGQLRRLSRRQGRAAARPRADPGAEPTPDQESDECRVHHQRS